MVEAAADGGFPAQLVLDQGGVFLGTDDRPAATVRHWYRRVDDVDGIPSTSTYRLWRRPRSGAGPGAAVIGFVTAWSGGGPPRPSTTVDGGSGSRTVSRLRSLRVGRGIGSFAVFGRVAAPWPDTVTSSCWWRSRPEPWLRPVQVRLVACRCRSTPGQPGRSGRRTVPCCRARAANDRATSADGATGGAIATRSRPSMRAAAAFGQSMPGWG